MAVEKQENFREIKKQTKQTNNQLAQKNPECSTDMDYRTSLISDISSVDFVKYYQICVTHKTKPISDFFFNSLEIQFCGP